MSADTGPALADPGTRWADLRLRVISASIAGPVVLLCVWFGGLPYDLLLLAGFAGVAWEWGAMCRGRPPPFALGVLYVGFALWSLWQWRDVGGARAVYIILAVVWCSDVGAYVAGRVFGGPRLAPRISPGKTWSGAVGGLAAAIVGGLAVSGTVTGRVAIIAAVLGVASQLGDLGESALKRAYNVKDSGRMLPGHGGLLDRLDGLLAAATVAGLFLLVAGSRMGSP